MFRAFCPLLPSFSPIARLAKFPDNEEGGSGVHFLDARKDDGGAAHMMKEEVLLCYEEEKEEQETLLL